MFQEQLMTLKEECEKARQELQEAKEKVVGIEAHSELQISRQQDELAQLHASLARALQQVQEKEGRAQQPRHHLATLQEKMASPARRWPAWRPWCARQVSSRRQPPRELLKEPPE